MPSDVSESVGGGQSKLGRTPGAAGCLGAGKRTLDVLEDFAGYLLAAGLREPEGRELVQLDSSVLTRPGHRVLEQQIHSAPPVAGVILDLAREAFEPVPAACLVADAPRELGRVLDDVHRLEHAAAHEQKRAEPVAGVEHQPGQHAALRFLPRALGALDRLLDTAGPPKRSRQSERRGEMRFMVEAERRGGALSAARTMASTSSSG